MSSRHETIFMPSFSCKHFASGQLPGSRAIGLSRQPSLRYGYHLLSWGAVGIVFAYDVLVRVCVLGKTRNGDCMMPRGALRISSQDTRKIVESLLRQTYDGPCQLLGTQFQISVWRSTCTVPRGSCITYGDLAKRIHKPQSARAVGRALSTNPLALLIPCHRVVARNGSSGGYRWGVSLKKALLDVESPSAG